MCFRCLLLILVFSCKMYGQTKPTFEEEKKKLAFTTLTEAIANQDSVKMADGYYEMGKYELGIGNLISGNAWYRKALPIYKKQKRYFEYGRIYQRMAESESTQKNFKQAIIYSDSALGIFRKHGLAKGVISNYLFVCGLNYWHFKKSPAEVLRNFDEMLEYAKKNDLEVEYTFLYRIKGNILKDSDPKAALKSFELSKIYMKKYGFERLFYGLHAVMAESYARIGQPEKARALLKYNPHTKHTAKDERFASYLAERSWAEIEIFKAEKNWEKAFKKLVEYTELQNEIRASEENKLASKQESMEVSAMGKSQERELLIQSQILKTNKRLFLILYAVGALLVLLGFVLFFQSRKNKMLAQKYLNISRKNELLIKEQSHRVKNNLQVISSMLGLQKNRLKDQEMQESLEEMQGRIDVMSVLQQMFYDSNGTTEIKIEEYFEQILNKTEIIFNKNIEKELTIESILINSDLAIHFGIILNELLTNSFKYAFNFDNTKPKVQLVFSVKNSMVYMEYKDNGTHSDLHIFDKEYYTTVSTFGLTLIRLKSSELLGEYSFKYNNGLLFQLKCPYNEAKSFNSGR